MPTNDALVSQVYTMSIGGKNYTYYPEPEHHSKLRASEVQ